IVAVASRKASPGVTTLTALLALYWDEPEVQRVIVEADVSGGTLAARWSQAHKLSWDPGLLALSAARGEMNIASVAKVTQELSEDLRVAAAPPAASQIGPALTSLGERGAAALAGAESIRAFVDCGRLNAKSPAIHLARHGAITLIVCRPNLEEVHTLVPGVAELRDAGCELGLVCVGDGPYHPVEIAEQADIQLVGVLPRDDRAAELFVGFGLSAGRGFLKSTLARSMAELASVIQQRCASRLQQHPSERSAGDDLLPRSSQLGESVGFGSLLGNPARSNSVIGGVDG
ncbi:MAG: hypothetical protein ACC652_02455, partial [Acidimicrobiales bacterium]